MRRLLDAFGLGRTEKDSAARVVAHRYRVMGSLGECGVGERLVAEDQVNEEQVLLLLLEPSFAGPRIKERLAQLDVPYGDLRILRPHDSGIDELGRPYTVTRWVDGELLSAAIERERMPWSEICELVEDLADMLAASHRRRLVHGSLEPGRILVGKGGPWLLDFGLARALGRPTNDPAYMAPELHNGCAPSPLADLYSLAMIMYELVAGAPAFTGTLDQIKAGHRSRPVPEIGRRGTAPAEIDALLGIALAKKPDERFSDTLEFVETIRGIQASSSGVWSLSSLAPDSSSSLAPTTDLGAMLRTFSVVELKAARALIDRLIEARGG
ncbi:serine/threonine-protein kinase [Enhygromyxa salina]|uniref:Serine/threonine-protein kinase PknK n=1 Tax=Enhygromyxa salina TaxID=215803 RepID=A0A2S9YY56_9BACT|nr:serine/threonine-protein kinase [Enhygromyxa salina]PRQ10023.1 Serine/threonine-protein kinase PknK [Enhygromyxa salina]